jgi:hypothetical protein
MNSFYEHHPLNSVGHKNGEVHAVEQITGDPAQQFFPKPCMAERAGDQKVGADIVGFDLQCLGDRPCRNMFETDHVISTEAPWRLRCSTIWSAGSAPRRFAKTSGLTVSTVVRSVCSISGIASLTARAAARLEFQATAIWWPSVLPSGTDGINKTGRPVTNRSSSENV